MIPYIDPLDVRYKRFEAHPKPVAQAVMFCLMDVSGSMTEHMKDLAKRFYVLLYIFLKRRYKNVEVVFIRHTHQAQEVDEDTFFNSPETGGTVVSTALEEMQRVVAERYNPDTWNIYAAQASDGDNTASDNERTGGAADPRDPAGLPVLRLSGSRPRRRSISRRASSAATAICGRPTPRSAAAGAPMAMRKVGHRRDIYPVFRELFARKRHQRRRPTPHERRHPSRTARCSKAPTGTSPPSSACTTRSRRSRVNELGLDVYPNQIEVIGTEQMLDAYSSIGMPLFYKHWSFGKHFARNEALYRAGMQGLAYEIVINSNPCISYIMEENTATMQALVIAHAAFGHNHFFKNNYVFQQWTDADGILDYLEFARGYIAQCEERYGEAAVERLLDAAHALMSHGVHRYPRKRATDLRMRGKARARPARARRAGVQRPVAHRAAARAAQQKDPTAEERRRALLQLPQENILLFPGEVGARAWRPGSARCCASCGIIAQYFYPQSQTKLMNEGCATYVHYRIMNRLHEKGAAHRRRDGGVPAQPHQRGVPAGLRRSALLRDQSLRARLRDDAGHRAHLHRTDRRRTEQWFPAIAGSGDEMAVLRDVWANYRDESFILQYLSPRLIRAVRAVPRAGRRRASRT